jgi:hypothetical protein
MSDYGDRTMDDFRAALPKLAALHDRFVASIAGNFFWRFPRRIVDHDSVTFRFYKIIENWLSHVPASQWSVFETKVGEVVSLRDRKNQRHWEKLHDVFNEALGAKVLRTCFKCRSVSFVPLRDGFKTPDLRGTAGGLPHYLEVKTVHHSADERKSWYGGKAMVHTTKIPAPLAKKIRESYAEAIEQLCAPTDAARAVKVVLFVLNPDYNLDPIEESVEQLFLKFFGEIERKEFPLCLHVLQT